MKLAFHGKQSGIALIVVLIVIVVLGILAGGFAYTMRVETTLARRASFSSGSPGSARFHRSRKR